MTLEEHIKRYDDRAKSIRNSIVEKKESQEVAELLKELKEYRISHWKLRDMDYEYDFNSIFGKNPMYYGEKIWDLFGDIDASVEYEVMGYEEVQDEQV